ncbi:MAG TPA: hypothetical protein VFN35_13455 [Ktedonobacteraceae bacterium]|nr:hypothetical protein [Ktedonobacteraceae bacterium]
MQEQTQKQTNTCKAPTGRQRSVNSRQIEQVQPESPQVHRCANCDIEFFWSPTVAQGQSYCCTGCAAGGPCNCDYSLYRSVTITGIIYYDI